MKTTVELGDALIAEAKECARKNGMTMRQTLEAALRLYLEQRHSHQPFRLRTHTMSGNGVAEHVQEGSWETIRGLIYEGRGG